jgi:hypothetical protein
MRGRLQRLVLWTKKTRVKKPAGSDVRLLDTYSLPAYITLLKTGVGVEKVRDGNVFSAAMIAAARVLSSHLS